MTDPAAPHDLDRLYNLRERISELESGRVRTTDTKDRDISAETLAMFRRSAEAIEAACPTIAYSPLTNMLMETQGTAKPMRCWRILSAVGSVCDPAP